MIGGRACIAVRVARFAVVAGFRAAARRIATVRRARVAIIADFAGPRHTNTLFALIIISTGILVCVAWHIVELVVLASRLRIARAHIASTASVAGIFVCAAVAVIVLAVANLNVQRRCGAARKSCGGTDPNARTFAGEFALVIFVLDKTTCLQLLSCG